LSVGSSEQNVSSRRLWHFTCTHGWNGLGLRGVARPNLHLMIPALGPVVWLTDDPDPERDAVGLTSSMLDCDRLQFRYRALGASKCVPWSSVRSLVPPAVLRDLESFGKPESWWISREPLRVVLDDDRAKVAA
jgi:hypothetical protein